MDTLNQLQQSLTTNVTSNVTSTVNDQITKIFEMFIIPSIIITVVILVFYIARVVHRHKVDKAIFEIRDTLREMKETKTPPPLSDIPPKETVLDQPNDQPTQHS